MREKKVVDLFRISSRFLRSVHLERDFNDPSALSGYIPTDFVLECLRRLRSGLRPESGQRAWRITGDYGSGKSSLALFVAHWFNGNKNTIPSSIRRSVGRQIELPSPHFAPALVTCARQPLRHSIVRSLGHMADMLYGRAPRPKLLRDLQKSLRKNDDWSDDQVLDAVLQTNSGLIADGKAKGLLLVIDELGKYLEFAALQPQKEDLFLLQRLAEFAIRSGSEPLFLVCLLHQGFSSYADQLTKSDQREWEKIAGRFEEIVLDQPLEQIAVLVASALDLKTDEIPRTRAVQINNAMEQALKSRWLGSAASSCLLEVAARLYPLHPTVLPVLLRTFRRFGQNERSLFGFLLSNEPFGLQSFSEQLLAQADFYRIHNFYDYIRTNFGHRLALQSHRSHWSIIDSLIESFAAADELQIKILKTIGVLNLLDDEDLLPTEDIIIAAVAEDVERRKVRAAIQLLRTGKRAIYDRGRARGFCLWPHTSVDIERAYNEARRSVESPRRVADHLAEFLQTRPVVARRHYIKTGNLRFYSVLYRGMDVLTGNLEGISTEADGLIIVPICETVSERSRALQIATDPVFRDRPNWVVAVPQPLSNLAHLVHEVQCWEWVISNTLELNGDKYAREEVSRQYAASRWELQKRVQQYIGLGRLAGSNALDWYHRGEPLRIRNGRHLLSELSRILDEAYHLAPNIHNELINRRNLSSSAAAARMRLIERMFSLAGVSHLGMDPDKKPPEMSIYLSMLQNTGIHRKIGDEWQICEPRPKVDQQCRILPALHCIRDLVMGQSDVRINVLKIFEALRLPPYGVRDGLIPLLITVFAITHEKDLAFYKDGTFLRELTAEDMLLFTKVPERFEVQYYRISGMRAELFRSILTILGMHSPQERRYELLGAVKKLCVFVARLPQYVLNTKALDRAAIAVRDAILNARDPARLLFTDLPVACGIRPIAEQGSSAKEIQHFIRTLKGGLEDLRAAYPELHERLKAYLLTAFNSPDSFQHFRSALAERAEQLLISVTESKLRAFCLRLMDANLPEDDWLESVGSYLACKPPAKWQDEDEGVFKYELGQIAARFHHAESILFSSGKPPRNSIGFRLAITQATGNEHEEVVRFTIDEEHQIMQLQLEFETLLNQHKRLGLAAASRALWEYLERAQKNE